MTATAALDATARSAWCRERGLYVADLERWKRDAIGGLDTHNCSPWGG